jgi:hypothetical protein
MQLSNIYAENHSKNTNSSGHDSPFDASSIGRYNEFITYYFYNYEFLHLLFIVARLVLYLLVYSILWIFLTRKHPTTFRDMARLVLSFIVSSISISLTSFYIEEV